MDDARVLRLLDDLYAASGDLCGWNLFLRSAAEKLGASTALFILSDLRERRCEINASFGMSSEALELYNKHYGKTDEWFAGLIRNHIAPGTAFCGPELCAMPQLLRSEFYNDFLRKHEMENECGVLIERSEHSFAILSLLRAPGTSPFNPEIRILRTLVPHLKRAVQLHKRLAQMQEQTSSQSYILDQMQFGVVVIGSTGQVQFVNRMARELVQNRDGVYIAAGGLHATNNADECHLKDLIGSALTIRQDRPAGGCLRISRVTGNRALIAVVTPLGPAGIADIRGALAVFLTDPERAPRQTADMLRKAFDLTKAEARLTLLMLQGNTLEQAANISDVALGTARSQLKSVLHKTNCSRQADLMRLLAAMPSPDVIEPMMGNVN